jgi:hypothetical protein
MKKAPLLIALIVLLVAAPIADAALSGRYKGKTEQNYNMSFRVKNGKVVRFRSGINLFCIGGGFQVDAVSRNKGIRIKRGGKFRAKAKYSDGSTYVISGRVRGRRARGSVKLSGRAGYDSSGSLVFCNGTAKWSAKRK